jgi:hypothetical protein
VVGWTQCQWGFCVKRCKFYPERDYFYSSCDLIDAMSSVSVCPLHPNPFGRFRRRCVKEVAS